MIAICIMIAAGGMLTSLAVNVAAYAIDSPVSLADLSSEIYVRFEEPVITVENFGPFILTLELQTQWTPLNTDDVIVHGTLTFKDEIPEEDYPKYNFWLAYSEGGLTSYIFDRDVENNLKSRTTEFDITSSRVVAANSNGEYSSSIMIRESRTFDTLPFETARVSLMGEVTTDPTVGLEFLSNPGNGYIEYVS